MVNHKTIVIGIIALFITAMLVSPVFGHRKYQAANPHGAPRWQLRHHTHPAGYVEPKKTEQVDLLAGVAEFIGAGFKAIGETIDAVFAPAEGTKIMPVGEVYEHHHKRIGWRRGLPGRMW